MTRRFEHEPLSEILDHLRDELDSRGRAKIRVPDPDRGHGLYPGEPHTEANSAPRHRPLRVWTDIADRLALRLHTPVRDGDTIVLTFRPLDPSATLLNRADRGVGKYSPGSGFHRASKLEDPDFLLDLADALERCELPLKPSVLCLGVNTGDELRPILRHRPQARVTGIDHDAAALQVARSRFSTDHVFIEADLGHLPTLPTYDLVISVDTLQSPGVDDRALLRHVVQRLLEPDGRVILGVPNCRYLDGELLHGARVVNYRQPELSLLLKGLSFYTKYLRQHRKRVFVTGKHELLVTAIPIGRRRPSSDADRSA